MNENKSYDDGICDLWDCMKDVARIYNYDLLQKLFHSSTTDEVILTYNPWEVMRIVKTYKKQQKLKNNEYVKEISELQTYKLHEDSEKMVILDDVIRILTDERE